MTINEILEEYGCPNCHMDKHKKELAKKLRELVPDKKIQVTPEVAGKSIADFMWNIKAEAYNMCRADMLERLE